MNLPKAPHQPQLRCPEPDTDAAGGRARALTLLTGIFAPPGEELLALMASERLGEAVADALAPLIGDDAGSVLARRLEVAAGDLDCRALEVEYARLFLGPGLPVAPPWEHAWLDPEASERTDSVARVQEDVEAAYQAAGFALSPSEEPADYLGTELEFLARLAEAAQASGAASTAQAFYDEFMAAHFRSWAARLGETVSHAAQHPLYTAFGEILVAVCCRPTVAPP